MNECAALLDAATGEPSMIWNFTEWVFLKFDQFIEWADSGGTPIIWGIICAVLILTGVGLPTPEDIWLTLAGFLTYHSGFFGLSPGLESFSIWHFAAALLFCSTSNVIGDSMCWWLGRNIGLPIREKSKFFQKLISDRNYARVRWWFRKYGGGTVFIGRQMAGVRFVTFFTAGTVRMPWARFAMWDFIGCFLSIPVWFTLGALGHIHREDLKELFLSAGNWMLLGGAVLVVGFFLYIKFFRVKKDKAKDKRSEIAEKVTAESNADKHLVGDPLIAAKRISSRRMAATPDKP